VLAIHAATLWLDFETEIAARGWREEHLAALDLSLALPLADLDPPEAEEGGSRWWSRSGGLTVLAMRHDRFDADAWHAAGLDVNARPGALYTRRGAARMVTAGELADGRAFHSVSERVGDGWSTIFLAAEDAERRALSLIAASIRAGRPRDWTLPAPGRLDDLVALTGALLVDLGRDPIPAVQVPAPRPAPVRADPARTGTGFFVGPRTLVTAAHVVSGCRQVARADGALLDLIATDPDLDLAVLGAAEPAPAWLGLSDAPATRLGQRIQALGYPYFRLTGTGLNATGGNISALAGIDDDRRFVALSAPVQPGNSGGPLIGAGGAVLGVVVARLSEEFIAEATGTLPQNINYAVTSTELLAFLRRHGAASAPGGIAGYDLDAGAPPGIERAIVPLVCD
jgi:serine protease Do